MISHWHDYTKIVFLTIVWRIEFLESRRDRGVANRVFGIKKRQGPYQRLLQYFRQEKVIVWTKDMEEEMGRRSQSQDTFWRRYPDDFHLGS